MKQHEPVPERAILAGAEWDSRTGVISPDLEELAALTESAGAIPVARVTQRRDRPDPSTFVGQGKVQEIAALVREEEADLVIFDDELSPAQQRNLQEQIGVRVLDRTALILDIFAQRARTKEAKLQVEMAQLNYILPHLVGLGSELSRQGGGIGTRGPGESRLETDRRHIRNRLAILSRELKEVRQGRELRRRPRQQWARPVLALVGYTNAGKSTLFRRLTGADVEVENKLFCTLDPTIRLLTLPNHQEVFLSDTVGFIRKLPHQLVESFRATLEEAVKADLLIHVMDASHPQAETQRSAVLNVLKELGAEGKPTVTVANKADVIDNEFTIARLLAGYSPHATISAINGKGVDTLMAVIMDALAAQVEVSSFFLPYPANRALALLHEKGRIHQEEYRSDGIFVEAEIDKVWAGKIRKLIEEGES